MAAEKIDKQTPQFNEPEKGPASFLRAVKKLSDTTIYYTSNEMFEMGMCACDKCGSLCSIDYKYCKVCDDTVTVFYIKKS